MGEKFDIFCWIASLFIKLLQNIKNSHCSSIYRQTLNDLGMASERTDLTLGVPRVPYISVSNSNSPASEDSDRSAIPRSLGLSYRKFPYEFQHGIACESMEMHSKQ